MTKKRMLSLAAAGAVVAGLVYMPMAMGASAPKNLQDPQHKAKVISSPEQGRKSAIAAADTPTCNFNGYRNDYTAVAVRTTSDPKYYTSTSWTNLTCADLSIFIPRGKSALIMADVNAEGACYEPGVTPGSSGGWCQGRILIDNVDSYPAQGTDSSPRAWFNSRGYYDWATSSIHGSRIYTCPKTAPTTSCTVRVTPQVLNTTAGAQFWVDDISTYVTATMIPA